MIILCSMLLCGNALASNGIEVSAKISDYNVKAKKFVGVNGYHTVSIKNITDKNRNYRYTYCIIFDKHGQCYEKYITLRSGGTFGDHNISYKHVGKEKAGLYPITVITKVEDGTETKVEANSTLTVY